MLFIFNRNEISIVWYSLSQEYFFMKWAIWNEWVSYLNTTISSIKYTFYINFTAYLFQNTFFQYFVPSHKAILYLFLGLKSLMKTIEFCQNYFHNYNHFKIFNIHRIWNLTYYEKRNKLTWLNCILVKNLKQYYSSKVAVFSKNYGVDSPYVWLVTKKISNQISDVNPLLFKREKMIIFFTE